jgi:hypothetical protein
LDAGRQMKKAERGKRRKIKKAGLYLGHMMNNHMTVIGMNAGWRAIIISL